LTLGFSFPSKAQSPERKFPPGVFGSLSKLISVDKKIYKKKHKALVKNPKTLDDLDKVSDIKIDSDFLVSILLNSPSKYMSLAEYNECSFYNLLNTELLRSAEGDIFNVMIDFKNTKSKRESAIVSKKVFLDRLVPTKCPKILDTDEYFRGKNLNKALEGIPKATFSSRPECKKFHENFRQDLKAPYYCDIYEKVKGLNKLKTKLVRLSKSRLRERELLKDEIAYAEKIRNFLTQKEYSTLTNLCEHIDDVELYCKAIFNSSFWDKVAQGEKDISYMKPYCEPLRKTVNNQIAQRCTAKLNSDPELCSYASIDYQALFPKPTCPQIGRALNHSRMFTRYQDCPGRMGNEGITNIARIIRHFSTVSDEESNIGMCFTNNTVAFAEANINGDNEKSWGLKLCYFDKIKDQEICHQSIIGNHKYSTLDQGKVLVKILNRLTNLSMKTQCKTIDKRKFNPAILEYKTGCYILVDTEVCLATNCPLTVINKGKEVQDFELVSDFSFSYIKNNIRDRGYTQMDILKRQFDVQHREVRSTTSLKAMLDTKATAVIHGIGCAEDILPHFFKKTTFNQCSPLPFIIDGYEIRNDRYYLVTRTSVDDIHAPRMIMWSYIFNAVKNYQILHPLESWSLNATY
jgi:hypothetical protein